MPERTLLRANSEKDRERCPYAVEYRYVEVAEHFKPIYYAIQAGSRALQAHLNN